MGRVRRDLRPRARHGHDMIAVWTLLDFFVAEDDTIYVLTGINFMLGYMLGNYSLFAKSSKMEVACLSTCSLFVPPRYH